MTPTQQERRIQALYDDSTVSRRNLCERTVHLEADMEDVQAENAKLREELEAAKHDLQVFSANLARLGAENARLVDVLHEVEEEAVLAFNSLRQDCKTITDSSQHFFEKWWHAECEADRLKAENVKLRELVRDAWGSGHPDKSCGDCEIRDECHDDMERLSRDGVLRFSRCLFELRIEERMRELGIEVDE